MTDVSQLLAEAKDLLDAFSRCDRIWAQLRRSESGTHLTYRDAVALVQHHRESLRKLLLVTSAEELMELIDQDQNDHLDEDEQLMLFSLIKERMQRIATDLRLSHEYSTAEALMQEARTLERGIFAYQQELRGRIYSVEEKMQRDAIAEDRRRFKAIWSSKLAEIQKETEGKISQLKAEQSAEMSQLQAEFSPADRSTIKPRESYLELQTEERMAAITEKYPEAKKARRILLEAEVSEAQRVHSELLKTHLSKIRNMQHRHKLELECALQRADTALERVKRRMEIARLQLTKAIANRLKTLAKVQADGYREGNKMGILREELRRTKDQSKKIVSALNDLKYAPLSLIKGEKLTRSSAPLPPLSASYRAEDTLVSAARLKALIPEVPKFKLRTEVLRIEAPNISNVPGAAYKKRGLRQSSPPVALAKLYSSDLFLLSPQSDFA